MEGRLLGKHSMSLESFVQFEGRQTGPSEESESSSSQATSPRNGAPVSPTGAGRRGTK